MKLSKKHKRKANKKGSRDAFLENGLTKNLITKIHKNNKKYKRNNNKKIDEDI